jgi:hypothetical protein
MWVLLRCEKEEAREKSEKTESEEREREREREIRCVGVDDDFVTLLDSFYVVSVVCRKFTVS